MRKWIRILHRDVGYFLCGLVALNAVSGLAVNHVDQWNPSYSTATVDVATGPLRGQGLDELEAEVATGLGLDRREITGRHRPDPSEFVLFLPDGGEARIDPATGKGTLKRVRRRPVLFEANVLHLNHLKGVWTWVADGFSLLLLGLALTGLFMLKGSTGLAGRGKWFVGAGLLVPIGFVAWYYATR